MNPKTLSRPLPTTETSRHMGAFVEVARRYLFPALVEKSNFCHIQQLAQTLPATPLLIFESRLAAGQHGLDFLICTSPPWTQQPEITAVAQQNDAWQAIYQLGQAWQAEPPHSLFKQGLDSLWLEFDTAQTEAATAVPGILFASMELSSNQNSAATHAQAVEQTLAKLQPTRLENPRFRQIMQHLTAVLPHNARVYALGDMAGRASPYVRVAISRVLIDDVIPFLQQVGWPGEQELVAHLLEKLRPFGPEISLDLDVGDTVGPVLGLELLNKNRFDHAWWGQLFAFLVAEQLCTPAKQEAFLKWPGNSVETHNPAIWPNQLVDISHLKPPVDCLLLRFINHVKLVCRPNQAIEAKGYIGLRQVCFNRQSKN